MQQKGAKGTQGRRLTTAVDNCRRLESIGQDDVWVHRRDVKMVDRRRLLALGSIAEHLKPLNDGALHIVVIFNLRALDSVLDFQRKAEVAVNLVNTARCGRRELVLAPFHSILFSRKCPDCNSKSSPVQPSPI